MKEYVGFILDSVNMLLRTRYFRLKRCINICTHLKPFFDATERLDHFERLVYYGYRVQSSSSRGATSYSP